MTVSLTTKERMLLQDQKSQEELCVQKYGSYSGMAQDPQLKQLFSSLGQKEQEHLNSINQILAGSIPSMASSGSGSSSSSSSSGSSGSSGIMSKIMQGSQGSQSSQSSPFSDKDLCSDMLSTEKYVSSSYDTAIFECTNPAIRQVLNHIQKEEQQHGEQIFNYMQSHGMYSVQ